MISRRYISYFNDCHDSADFVYNDLAHDKHHLSRQSTTMTGRTRRAFDLLSQVATLSALAGLCVSAKSLHAQLVADKETGRQSVALCTANTFVSDRLLQVFIDVYGGADDPSAPWKRAINSSLRMMQEKMATEQLLQEFLRGKSTIEAVTGSPSTILLSTARESWRRYVTRLVVKSEVQLTKLCRHYTAARDPRTSRQTLQEWYGGPTCRLGKFWTTIALMNVAERHATGNYRGAEDIENCYNEVTSKLGRSGECSGFLLSPEQVKRVSAEFKAKAVSKVHEATATTR